MSHYITIQEAALLSKKSLQTIRRLLKTNRIKYRRQETPQGFIYMVEQGSLKNFLAAPVRVAYGTKPKGERKKNAIKMPVIEATEEEPIPDSEIQSKPLLPQITEVETVRESTDDPDASVYALGKTVGASAETEKPVDNILNKPEQETIPEKKNVQPDTVEQLLATIRDLQAQHAQDKNKLYDLLENFQRRAILLEERVKQLEGPKIQKSWWRFW